MYNKRQNGCYQIKNTQNMNTKSSHNIHEESLLEKFGSIYSTSSYKKVAILNRIEEMLKYLFNELLCKVRLLLLAIYIIAHHSNPDTSNK